jgi:hypothetical protein
MSSSCSKPGRQNGAAKNGGNLEFPVAPDFVSVPPPVEFQAMLRRIEETMP